MELLGSMAAAAPSKFFSDAAFFKQWLTSSSRGKRRCECNVLLGSRRSSRETSVQLEALTGALSSSRMVTLLTRRFPREDPLIRVSESSSVVDAAIVLVLGAGASDAAVQKLKEARAGICITTKPFSFECQTQQRKAQKSMEALQDAANVILVVEREMFLRRKGMTVMEASKVSKYIILLAAQAFSQLISGKSAFYYDSSSHDAEKPSTLDVVLQLSGKGIARFGIGYSITKAVEDAFLTSPLSTEENKGIVICALAKSPGVTKDEAHSVIASLRALLGSEVTIICSPVQHSILNAVETSRAAVLITRLESGTSSRERKSYENPVLSSLSSVPGITSASGFTFTGDSPVSELEVSDQFRRVSGSFTSSSQPLERKTTRSSRAASSSEKELGSWDSGPHSSAAKAWAQSRVKASELKPALPVGVRETSGQEVVRSSYTEMQANKTSGRAQVLPHDPAAVPPTPSVFRMGLDAVLDVCKSASEMMQDKDYKKQPSLSQRAASMLETERAGKSLSPSVEMSFRNGSFKGRWDGGLPDGKGRLTYADGSFYDGNWEQGRRSGMGTFYYANGDVYQGQWLDDLMHGQGWLYFHTGDRLQAEFIRGKAHGVGQYFSADGSVLFGQFHDNWRHGQCIFRDSSGLRWSEVWDSGVLVSRQRTM